MTWMEKLGIAAIGVFIGAAMVAHVILEGAS